MPNEPPAEGDPVLVLLPPLHAESNSGSRRAVQAVVSSSWSEGAPWAREREFGVNLRPLPPAYEGITWCRGWEPEARDALLAAWKLHLSAT